MTKPLIDLTGTTAIITGASRGIGRATAILLSSLGCKLALNYNKSPEAAEETLGEVSKSSPESFLIKFDVANSESVKSGMGEAIEKLGKIDFLVNNAGITRDNLLMRMKDEDIRLPIETNLMGTIHCCQAVSRSMVRARTGSIVNISSVVGVAGNAGQSNYSASKAAIIGFTKSLAKELASRSIRVNSIAPGAVDTDMFRALTDDQAKALAGNIPLGTVATPEDVANSVLFLLSDMSKQITGQVLHVNGGLYM